MLHELCYSMFELLFRRKGGQPIATDPFYFCDSLGEVEIPLDIFWKLERIAELSPKLCERN